MPRPLALAALLAACSSPVVEGTSEPAATTGEPSTGDDAGPTSAPTSSSPTSSSAPDTGDTGLPGSESTSLPTTGDTGDSSDSGDPTTTAVASTCGDGIVDAGEQCDDGNADDADDCTTKCAPPSCDDDLRSGDETDVDCGGGCPACAGGGACVDADDCASLACDAGTCAAVFESCRGLHDMHPALPDGSYTIDPGADGTTLLVYCDMVNGGWTEVVKDTLDTDEGWSAGDIAACGNLSDKMLGPLGMGAKPGKMFALLGVPHEKARAHATFVILDSWDNERATVYIDGDEVGAQVCHHFDNPAQCGIVNNQCGSGIFSDGKVTVIGEADHTADTALVEVSSTLDEGLNNEAFGLDALSVFVY